MLLTCRIKIKFSIYIQWSQEKGQIDKRVNLMVMTVSISIVANFFFFIALVMMENELIEISALHHIKDWLVCFHNV
jgi:hypothetical protein